MNQGAHSQPQDMHLQTVQQSEPGPNHGSEALENVAKLRTQMQTYKDCLQTAMKILKERDFEIEKLHQEIKALRSKNSFLNNQKKILINDKILDKSEASDKVESPETQSKQAASFGKQDKGHPQVEESKGPPANAGIDPDVLEAITQIELQNQKFIMGLKQQLAPASKLPKAHQKDFADRLKFVNSQRIKSSRSILKLLGKLVNDHGQKLNQLIDDQLQSQQQMQPEQPSEIERNQINIMAKSGSVSDAEVYFIRTSLKSCLKDRATIEDLLSYVKDELCNWYEGSWVVQICPQGATPAKVQVSQAKQVLVEIQGEGYTHQLFIYQAGK